MSVGYIIVSLIILFLILFLIYSIKKNKVIKIRSITIITIIIIFGMFFSSLSLYEKSNQYKSQISQNVLDKNNDEQSSRTIENVKIEVLQNTITSSNVSIQIGRAHV